MYVWVCVIIIICMYVCKTLSLYTYIYFIHKLFILIRICTYTAVYICIYPIYPPSLTVPLHSVVFQCTRAVLCVGVVKAPASVLCVGCVVKAPFKARRFY